MHALSYKSARQLRKNGKFLEKKTTFNCNKRSFKRTLLQNSFIPED